MTTQPPPKANSDRDIATNRLVVFNHEAPCSQSSGCRLSDAMVRPDLAVEVEIDGLRYVVLTLAEATRIVGS